MKPLSEQSHYEVLEIDRDASLEEVERAYRMAQATYAEDSLATYSLLGEDEASGLRDRLELAYEVLSDAVSRQRYDAGLDHEDGDELGIEADPLLLPPDPEPGPALSGPALPGSLLPAAAPLPSEPVPRFEGFDDVEDEEGDAPWDGARLRRARLVRGVDVEQIATITKINPTYLHFIESDRYESLPASVYVRGFVTAYARCLGLEPTSVATSYMERLQEERGEPGQGSWSQGA